MMAASHGRGRRRRWRFGRQGPPGAGAPEGVIALVGSPNVGKSCVFNALTGLYATVSNYPGTTVALAHGTLSLAGRRFEVVDTPGMYSLSAISQEERVARRVLLDQAIHCVVHVVDAKNLERMLPLTLQMLEAGLPVVLDLNMMDEAEKLGIIVDAQALSRELGIPVVTTVATSGQGIEALRRAILGRDGTAGNRRLVVRHQRAVEEASRQVADLVHGEYGMGKRSLALLLLQEDDELMGRIREAEPEAASRVHRLIHEVDSRLARSLGYHVRMRYQRRARELVRSLTRHTTRERHGLGVWLGRLCMEPLTGVPILLAVLYFGLYKLVGGVGAGTLVNWLEGGVFEQWLNPAAMRATEALLPWSGPVWSALRELVVGEYGLITLGLRYAIAIILPIVGVFFLVFSVIEDSGYFPRLAMLVDRLFKRIGLNGRAVIPLVLGFGCDTMAVMVTRLLETRRERVIAIFLLSLAIPCSAQLGVITGLLGRPGRAGALLFWAVFVALCFLVAGFLASRLAPGAPPSFYMELPPIRLPKLSNILSKTWSRMRWYFWEVLPVFLLASVVLWAGTLMHLFPLTERLLSYPVRAMGLPGEASRAFLFGFFRRDYGVAGLYDLEKAGLLNVRQLTVAAVVLTLFVPCIAQLLINRKETGLRTTVSIVAIIVPFAFLSGILVNVVLGTFPQLILR
jgi:ferrous iron transport protein B